MVFRYIHEFPWGIIRSLLSSTVSNIYLMNVQDTTPSVKIVKKCQRWGTTLHWHKTENISSNLFLNLAVQLSERCFCTEPTFAQSQFQNGYPFKYPEFRSNKKAFNIGRAYYCQLDFLVIFALVTCFLVCIIIFTTCICNLLRNKISFGKNIITFKA